MMFRCKTIALAVFAASFLTACATVSGPRDVVMPLAKVQTALASRFPIKQRYADVIDVTAANPRLQLQSESNRIVTTVDATIAPVLSVRRLHGSFTISGVLAIDQAQRAVVLREPRMEKLSLDGMDETMAIQLAKLSSTLAQKITAAVPLYVFDSEQFRDGSTRYIPTRISTSAEALTVTFEPVK